MALAHEIRECSFYDQPITQLRGVGSEISKRLSKINLKTFRDLLFHLPIRYEDRTRLVPVKDCVVGTKALVQGEVISSTIHKGRKRWLEVLMKDHQTHFKLTFFHFSTKQKEAIDRVGRLRCYGEIVAQKGMKTMVHPELVFLSESEQPLDDYLTPVYPTTQGVAQGVLRKVIYQVLDAFEHLNIDERLPLSFSDEADLVGFKEAICVIHRPSPEHGHLEPHEHPAFQRLVAEELFAHQANRRLSKLVRKSERSCALACPASALTPFLKALPFDLTKAQQRALEAVREDLTLAMPMMRLVQGDVGCGKTVVAAGASLYALHEGKQVALMAPTEILAEQHAQQFQEWLEPLGYEVCFLAGKSKAKIKKETLEKIKSQSPLMVIGTHALFQDSVIFNDLALMIVDEQHRFGVHQRMQLRAKGQAGVAHQLIMTATPIPRTLAMTQYADLDLTVIDELPPNRKPVTTICLNQDKRNEVIQRIQSMHELGQQVYWVCPLIEESEKLQIQAAQQALEILKHALPKLTVELVHGRMNPAEKEAVMQTFKQGKIHVLVATTVIEVGVNVPKASLMVIENPERLGLAQLHQLRGRVGRGADQSFCVLLYKSPLSYFAEKRLKVMRQTQDGFKIADMDLKIRGPGEVLGVRQTGTQLFRIAHLLNDQHWVETIHQWMSKIPKQQLSQICDDLSLRWLGSSRDYGKVG